jgi:hypothetical protein
LQGDWRNDYAGIEQYSAFAEDGRSFVFNRGVSMGHEPEWRLAKEVDRRSECCELREDVKKEMSSRSMLTLER